MKPKFSVDPKTIQGYQQLEPTTPEKLVADASAWRSEYSGLDCSVLPYDPREARREDYLEKMCGIHEPTNPISPNQLVTEYDLFYLRYGISPQKLFLHERQTVYFERPDLIGLQIFKYSNATSRLNFRGVPIIKAPEYLGLTLEVELKISPTTFAPQITKTQSSRRKLEFPEQGIVFTLEGEDFQQAYYRVGEAVGAESLQHLEDLDEARARRRYEKLDQNLLSLLILGDPEVFKLLEQYQSARGSVKLKLVNALEKVLDSVK